VRAKKTKPKRQVKGHLAVAEVLSVPFRVVVETIHIWSYLMREIKITPAISALLTAIRSKEAPKGYGQVYGGIPAREQVDVSKMTVGGVLAWQSSLRKRKISKSTAAGAYQFIYLTLAQTVKEMGISLDAKFDAALQDKMAVYLMQKRGFNEYLDGKLSPEAFANNLAMEWASVPVVTPIKGAKRFLQPGDSYYKGDKLNAAHHDPKVFLALVKAIRTPAPVAEAPSKPVQPVSAPEAPKVAQEEVKPPVAVPEPVKVSWLGRLFGWGA